MQQDQWSAGGEVMLCCSIDPELGLQVEDHPGSASFDHEEKGVQWQVEFGTSVIYYH